MSQKPIAILVLLNALLLGGCSLWGTKADPGSSGSGELVLLAQQPEAEMIEAVEQVGPSAGLQLGAFSQPEGASRMVQRLQQEYPIVFENRSPIIRAIARDGTTLYRVILGPFSDTKIAGAFCKLLRQKGEVCFVTQFDRLDLRIDRIPKTKDSK